MDLTAIDHAQEIVNGKWVPAVLAELERGSRRRNELARRIDGGLRGRVLTLTLNRMRRDGLVERHSIDGPPFAVHYRLTPLGRSLLEPLEDLADWMHAHHAKIEQARREFDAHSDPRDAEPDGSGADEQ